MNHVALVQRVDKAGLNAGTLFFILFHKPAK
jgi:hypothetical protein